ncbi:MAG: tetratricopeptide repeat protein, partial [Methylovulum sp.]|nr:tetratricopeptide repeat protein [Methylovulum sp.]
MNEKTAVQVFSDIRILLYANKSDEALAMAESALLLFPNEAEGYFWCAESYGHKGESAKAIDYLKKACALDAYSVSYLGRLAEHYLFTGQLDLAIEYYQKSLAIEPLVWAYIGLGNAFEKKSMIPQAIGAFEKALGLGDHLPRIVARLQLLKQAYNDAPNAKSEAPIREDIVGQHDDNEPLAKRDDNEPFANKRLELANMARLEGDNAKALSLYSEYLFENPTDVLINHRVGDLYLHLKQYDRAKEYYQKTLAIDPGFFWALHNLSLVSGISGDWPQALHYYAQLCQLRPGFWDECLEDYTVQAHLGYLFLHSDALDDAKRVFEHALALSPKGWESYLGIALCLNKEGKSEAALDMAKKGLVFCKGNKELQAFIDATNMIIA